MKLIKEPQALELSAHGRSTFRSRIKDGLMTPPVRLGENSVAWPEREVLAVNAARIAGKSDDEVRQLVARLVAERKPIDDPEKISEQERWRRYETLKKGFLRSNPGATPEEYERAMRLYSDLLGL